MPVFQVQIWPNGDWDGQPFQPVEAETAQEAAEKLYGRRLKRIGKMAELRVRVHDPSATKWRQATVFFEAETDARTG